jgi:hypothetical protein
MVAAAYAKDLLCRIPPNKVEAEKRIIDILSGLFKRVNDLSDRVLILLQIYQTSKKVWANFSVFRIIKQF